MSTNATGPRTPEGKQHSSLNATKHGLRTDRPIIPGEDPAEWDLFRDDIVKDLDPGSTIERELAERIALQMWRLRRAARYEAEVATDAFEQAAHDLTGTVMGLHAEDPATQSIQAMKRCVDYARSQLTLAETTLDTARRLPKLADHAVLDTLVVINLLELAACPLPETREPVPTAGEVRRVLANGLHLNQKDALARAIAAAEARVAEAEKEIPFQERRLDLLLEDVARRGEANQREQRLLRDKALERVVRYEAHVSKQLKQALELLRQFKDERRAKEMPAEAPTSFGNSPAEAANGAAPGSFGPRPSAARSGPNGKHPIPDARGSFGNLPDDAPSNGDASPGEPAPGKEFVRQLAVLHHDAELDRHGIQPLPDDEHRS